MMRLRLAIVTATVCVLVGVSAVPAVAGVPVWKLRAIVAPASLPPGGKGEVLVRATNLGDMAARSSSTNPIKISAKLPPGVTAISVSNVEEATTGVGGLPEVACELSSLVCEATNNSEGTSGRVLAYASVEIAIEVSVAADTRGGLVGMSVSGGGAAPVSASDPVTVSGAPARFGVERFGMVPLNEDGSLDTQAGSHPFQLTTTIAYNQAFDEAKEVPEPLTMPKDQKFSLPPGLIGNPAAIPQCPIREFLGNFSGSGSCPADTQIGVVSVDISLHGEGFSGLNHGQPFGLITPVYNLEPSVGEPARFGFTVGTLGSPVQVFLDTSVRTGGDYGVDVTVHNISQEAQFVGAQLSIWGVPGDPRHDLTRGNCIYVDEKVNLGEGCVETGALKQSPFLTLPASCTGLSNPFTASVGVTSWAQPTVVVPSTYVLHDGAGVPVGLDGCNRLPFDPSIGVAPDGKSGSTPTGLTVGVHVAQDAALNPTGLTEADVKDTTVALPAGVQLSPSAADGLASCSDAQIGFTGVNPHTGVDEFTSGAPSCPDASKVATVRIKTPLLPNALEGAVYLAAPQNFAGPPFENPFGSLVALYIVAQDPVSGVLVKLPGRVTADPVSGQLVSTFENTPQLPFEDLELHFFGSARAPLSTPALCGAYTTTASFTPWSGNPPASPSSTFEVLSGPNGSPCADPLPFSPSLTAGTTSIQAGGFSPFTMTMSREDGQQNLRGVQLMMPPGLLGTLSSVKLCGEPQADAGTCGPESLIGHTIVSVGLGGDPYSVTGGQVFITGPYQGAPYGLSIVNPAKAGPFDLGRVVVRARIEVDLHTADLTVATDSSGPYAIPRILDGIPLQIKHVNVSIDRPGFTFNPTDCERLQIGGSLTSDQGASSTLSVPFQVTNCAVLEFKPQFKVSTSGHTSRQNGASLDVKLSYPHGSFGKAANIKSVKVDLPKQLPSRLTTLQKACPDTMFNQNPAACPAGSRVGTATASTPILSGGLSGPAYFVSHGGAKFPELIIVLSGEGVTVHLDGETFIGKTGITSSTFRQVPDVPVSSFELKLPQGPNSALAANGNPCTSTLQMPTAFTAQNGAVIHQTTPIGVTGCSKHKRAKKARKASTHRKANGKHKKR